MRIISNDRPYVPHMHAVWDNSRLNVMLDPIRFHGKPVRIQLRIHSKITIREARAI